MSRGIKREAQGRFRCVEDPSVTIEVGEETFVNPSNEQIQINITAPNKFTPTHNAATWWYEYGAWEVTLLVDVPGVGPKGRKWSYTRTGEVSSIVAEAQGRFRCVEHPSVSIHVGANTFVNPSGKHLEIQITAPNKFTPTHNAATWRYEASYEHEDGAWEVTLLVDVPGTGPKGRKWVYHRDPDDEDDNPYAKIFRQLDADRSGGLDQEEFIKFFQNLGTAMNKRQICQCFDAADKDSDGQLTVEEFVSWCGEHEGGIRTRDDCTDRRYQSKRFGDGYRPEHGIRSYPFMESGYTPSHQPHDSIRHFQIFNDNERDQLHWLAGKKVSEARSKGITMSSKYCETLLAYTAENKTIPPFHKRLTEACRHHTAESCRFLEEHQDFLYHLGKAAECAPNYEGTVFRCVDVNVCNDYYPVGETIVWVAPTSTSRKPLIQFLDVRGTKLRGTLFILNCDLGKQIFDFSVFPDEEEVFFNVNSMWCVKQKPRSQSQKRDALGQHLRNYDISVLDVVVMSQVG